MEKQRKRSDDVIDLSHSNRRGGKTFKKQYFEKADEKEKIVISRWSLTTGDALAFDPVVDPQKFSLKQPTKSVERGVSFLLFAKTPQNDVLVLKPMRHLVVGTGFRIHTSFFESMLSKDLSDWYASIVALSSHLENGIFVGTSLIDPHDYSELQVSMFNLGGKELLIHPKDPVGQIVFNRCTVPIISETADLSARFQGEKI